MESLVDLIQSDNEADEALLTPEYQANMFTIEEASRETGAIKPGFSYVRSPYDAALMRLIDSVPMR